MYRSDFPKLKSVKSGKVRDIYETEGYYLVVSTDRLSAFDVVMKNTVPGKGKALNRISEFWFGYTSNIIQNHMITTDVSEYPEECREYAKELEGRSMLVKKASLIPLECIVRGYITGSGWNEYQKKGSICGIDLPDGLEESEKLPEPIFTPSTKADLGDHDMNITEEEAVNIAGRKTFDLLKEKAIAVYKKASAYALEKGIIIADTKMEFGFIGDEIILIDELLTPDSSRFWNKEKYDVGKQQESFDKQYVRDYLLSINFNKRPPAPELPEKVINNTIKKYNEAVYRITGERIK